jgi:hypothetical protein
MIRHSAQRCTGENGLLPLTISLYQRCEVRLHLFFVHEGRLEADEFAARAPEEHIAAAEQIFGAVAVEHDAGIAVGGHLEGDTSGQVGFERTGNHIHARALGGKDQVDAG